MCAPGQVSMKSWDVGWCTLGFKVWMIGHLSGGSCISKCVAVAELGGAWPQSQPALEALCVVLPVITADKLLQLRLLSPAGCQTWGPRLRHGSPFILIRDTPCVIKKSVYYCRHALTATSIIVNQQMGGGQAGCVLQLFRSTGPAGEAQEEVSPSSFSYPGTM